MSHFDDNEERIIYGRHAEDDEEPTTRECRHCGKGGLHWEHDGDGWVLMEGHYKVHKCDPKKVARNVADDFEVTE